MKKLLEQKKNQKKSLMLMRERLKVVKSIAQIAVKCHLDGDKLLDSIMESNTNGEAKCGMLTITQREKTADSTIFLFTKIRLKLKVKFLTVV